MLLLDNELFIWLGVLSSKLDVVEMVIGFIRKFKEENVDMIKKLWEFEQKLV